jgi:vacuolar protein-sorting-associated protein 4
MSLSRYIACAEELAAAAFRAQTSDAQFSLFSWAATSLFAGARMNPTDVRAAGCKVKAEEYMSNAERQKAHLKKQIVVAESSLSSSPSPSPSTTPSPSQSEETIALQKQLQSVVVTKPNVRWDQVAGLEHAKEELKLTVIMPISHPQLFEHVKPWIGILLYGPPGTGKTLIAEALATESHATFFSVRSSDLVSKYQGESERLVKQLFDMARERRPTVVFIDEVDSLTSARGDGDTDSSRRIKNELLTQMNGLGALNTGVCVIGATNAPWSLDDGFRRRFEKRIYISLPDKAVVAQLVRSLIPEGSLTDEQLETLLERTHNFSAADVDVLVRCALQEPIREILKAEWFIQTDNDMYQQTDSATAGAQQMRWADIPPNKLSPSPLSFKHFEAALATCKSTINTGQLHQFEEWTALFGQGG